MKVSQPSSYSQCSICAGRANAFVSANRWNRQWVDFAHTFWHVDCVRKQSYNAFSERYQKWCKRHGYFFKQSNAEKVYALAKNAVVLAPKSGVTKVLVSFYFLVQDVLQSYRTGAPPRAICLVFAP